MALEKKKGGRPPGRIIKKHETVDLHPVHDDEHFTKSWMLSAEPNSRWMLKPAQAKAWSCPLSIGSAFTPAGNHDCPQN